MLTAAAVVLLLLAALHSVLGELLVFRYFHQVSGLRPLGFPPNLRPDSPARIIRACWHGLSVFGAGFAAILLHLAQLPALAPGDRFVVRIVVAVLLGCGLLVLVGTRAKHVGWIGFLAAAFLAWSGAR